MPSKATLKPFNFQAWIEAHRELLKPPVGNKLIWADGQMMAFVVGGPNARADFHDDPVEEFFYQLEGQMTLRIMREPGQPPEEIPIRAGEVFLLPAHIRHSPQRETGSIGLVIEPQRPSGAVEAFEWFCPSCHALVHRAEVVVEKIDDDLPPIFERFYRDITARTCAQCGSVHPGR